MNTITCTNCGQLIEVEKALEGQIQSRIIAAEHKKHRAELALVQKQATEANDRERLAFQDRLKREADESLERIKQQLDVEKESAQKKIVAEQQLLVSSLRSDAESEKVAAAQLRQQLTEIMKSLRDEKQARANAELNAEKKINLQADKIRDDATKLADERQRLKFAEYDKKLADTQKALDQAQRKATQGSQQNQGEVLELELEKQLRSGYPYDDIQEVKKGIRGADIKQVVRGPMAQSCGMILWETKNGKWQPAWVSKFKADIREASANVGVIVSTDTPPEIGSLGHLESNIWVVSPELATRLAAALRVTILQVDAANKMSAGKDAKMETLYQFLVGPEFKNRVESIVENYTTLQDEIEREKRASTLKWARQEKAIRAVIDNTIGMYGDLQGITNSALPAIPRLELQAGEEV